MDYIRKNRKQCGANEPVTRTLIEGIVRTDFGSQRASSSILFFFFLKRRVALFGMCVCALTKRESIGLIDPEFSNVARTEDVNNGGG